MTDRELMQMALDALDCIYSPLHVREINKVGGAIEALRARLAQPEPEPVATLFGSLPVYDVPPKQEPVAWGIANTRPTEKQPLMMVMLDEPEPSHLVVPLYTAPPQREWQGLTDEQYETMAEQYVTNYYFDTLKYAHAIEAKLKEKNT